MTYATSSAFVFGSWRSALVAATCTMASTIRQASLKLAAVAWRNIALDISRARVSREDIYSPTYHSMRCRQLETVMEVQPYSPLRALFDPRKTEAHLTQGGIREQHEHRALAAQQVSRR